MKKKYDDSIDYINGYPISEVWGTYHYLAREIAPRLKAFKALDKHGWPKDFENQEDWNKTIQKMIDAFELVKDYSRLMMKIYGRLIKAWNCSASIIVICRINNIDSV